MLINIDIPESSQYKIYDCVGHLIPAVVSFDTETEEIEVSICCHRNSTDTNEICVLMQKTETDEVAPILVKFKLAGAYAMKNNERVK